MAQTNLYNAAGVKQGTIELEDSVFACVVKPDVVHNVYVAHRSNARQPWSHSKDKSEIAGGGRKPWRQKGTGRARHGSIRSPLWRGGGITFGPLAIRNYKKKINKKMNRLAVKMTLSDKLSSEKLVILENIASETGKTKAMSELLKKLPGSGRTTLLVVKNPSDLLIRSMRNIPKVDIVRAMDVNIVDLLHHQYIVMSKEATETVTKRLS